MTGLLPDVDPDGLLEYSVVYTDRSVNHMSSQFQQTMRDIHGILLEAYNAHHAVIVPGSGTFAMEAVARQFAQDENCLVIRNGWFSYRWTQIFDAGKIPADHKVLLAQAVGDAGTSNQHAYEPMPVADVVAEIRASKPAVVCAPHVETSAGMILPDDYIAAIADAVHEYGGLFVLDCIASGTIWVDMKATGVDVLVTAPQKGWSGTPCAGVAVLSEHACQKMAESTSNSFAVDLKKWSDIMQAYLDGKHAYHATMPTDGLIVFRDVMQQVQAHGFDTVKAAQQELGQRIRQLMDDAGFVSVAAKGFQAPGVAVYFTDEPTLHNGSAFAAEGMQIAAGVPLQIGEPEGYQSFRIGLFGIDKLNDVDAAVSRFETVLNKVMAKVKAPELAVS